MWDMFALFFMEQEGLVPLLDRVRHVRLHIYEYYNMLIRDECEN